MIENVLRLIHSNANELSASLPSVTNNHFLCNVEASVSFASLSELRRTIQKVDFSQFMKSLSPF